MIRVLLYSLAAVIVVLGASWLSANTGTVEITWLGYQISTTLTFLFLLAVLFLVLLRIIFLPFNFVSFLCRRRKSTQDKARQNLLVAVLAAASAGDEGKYKALQRKVNRLYAKDDILRPLLLLNITSGEDRIALLNDLSSDNATELAGLKGRIDEAVSSGKKSLALELYRQAFDRFPKVEWIPEPLLELEAFFQKWDDVVSTAEAAYKRGTISKKRFLAVKSSALLEKGLSDGNKNLIYQAAKADRTNSAAQINAAVCYANQGNYSKALSVLLAIWKQKPSLALYDAVALITPKDSAYKRVKIVEKMARMIKSNPLSDLILADAYAKASLWGQAKFSAEKYLHLYPHAPRAIKVIAEAETAENPNSETAKRWQELSAETPAIKIWQCTSCHNRFNEWHSICSACANFATVYPDDERNKEVAE
ncbi:MAG: hypothetical protein IKD08_02615 [Alphaproteobacteria bacterium]|nr:hypothetical protein [Alphaproteobacteria bacterium]